VLRGLLAPVKAGLVLHGHLHKRMVRKLNDTGLLSMGATSASLHHELVTRHAGFNLYELDDATGRLVGFEAHVLDSESAGTFHVEPVPEVA
jgi:hypothetical protein